MINYNTMKEIYNSHYGSEQMYRRNYCHNLVYTEGVMDLQKMISAYWIVDNVVSYMPKVVQAYNDYEYDFFVVEITLNKANKGYMEVYTEGYIDDEYKEHISIIKQDIPFMDLPTNPEEDITTYKLFLELANYEPLVFCLLLPGEH